MTIKMIKLTGLALSPHSKQDPGSFACSPRVYMGSLQVLNFFPLTKNMHVMLTGDSKLSLGVSVSVDGCLTCLCLCGPVMDWRPVQVYPTSRPMTAGIGSSPPVTMSWIRWV